MTMVRVHGCYHSVGDVEKKKSEDASDTSDDEEEGNQESSESERSLSSEPESPKFREGLLYNHV